MIRVRQVKINLNENNKDAIKRKVALKLKVNIKEIKSIKISKQSLDARKKDNLFYVYEIDVELQNENKVLNNKSNDIIKTPLEKYVFPKGNLKDVVIVGSGPAGLFAAYVLAENGFKPLIIERGEQVEDRIKTVEEFWNTGKLNENSNVQFGEGGAGTFSDGKLNTLVKDKNFRMKKVFETFVKCGAPSEIMYLNKPHIGTDLLTQMLKNMRNKIIGMGGTFRYNTCLTDLIISDNKLRQIELNNNEIINCDNLILAIGHSARDTFEMLYKRGVEMMAKPFAVGIRIQHAQKMINESQYGKYSKILPSASYKLTYSASNNRGVYTFCMCPGGYVVNASSEKGLLAINGMSNYNRDSENANSAVIVTVSPDDYGTNPLDGVKFQRHLEEKAYLLGNGKIPVQLFRDFENNTLSEKFGEINPVFKGNYKFANLNELFPSYINDALKEGIRNFDKKIKGYAADDVILAGVESRTSSPLKIERNEKFVSNIEGIYPCGEGAGYAGGITTSAMDGIKVAEAIALS